MPAATRTTAPELGALPEDLLLDILGRLTTMERFSAAALVSKRWHQLCHVPQLLRSLRIGMHSCSRYDSNPDGFLPRVRSLQRFLASHAQHVRSLHLSAANRHPYVGWDPATVVATERKALATCLQCCTQLEQLTVCEGTLPTGVGTEQAADWLLAMPRLRRLNHLGSPEHELRLPAGLDSFTQLEYANLQGEQITLPSLPPSLTSLQLSDGDELPEQLTALTRLQRLDLSSYLGMDMHDGSASCTRLQQLSLLTHLSLWDCGIAPPASCLERLPRLRQLAIQTSHASDLEDREHLDASLAGCQQLTLLSLSFFYDEGNADPDAADPMLHIPHSIAQLRSLHTFLFQVECFGSIRIDTSLPAGPWLHSLRWLALPWTIVVRQAGTLAAAAPALQRIFLCAVNVHISTAEDSNEHSWNASFEPLLPGFESLVLRHPSLEFVGYAADPNYRVPPELAQTLSHLAARRPALSVAAADFPTVSPTDFSAFLDEPDLFGTRY